MPYRYRITYFKNEEMRYTSNLDVHRVWERSLRRARMPLVYSQGFHPQPKIQQACPLPLGFLSRAEMLDIYLDTPFEINELIERIQKNVPAGFEIHTIEEVALTLPALQMQIEASDFSAAALVPLSATEIQSSIEVLLAQPSLIRTRRDKEYDLRPLILSLLLDTSPDGSLLIKMRLSVREGATGRPEEVLAALGLEPFDFRVTRTALIFQNE